MCFSVKIDITWFPVPFPLAAPSEVSPGERHYVQFAGPIPVSSTEEAFTTICHAFPNGLKRISDGETGSRQGPLHWQTQVFEQAGLSHFLKDEAMLSCSPFGSPLPEVSIDPSLELDTRYGHHAITSYQTFTKLKAAGSIPLYVKFQVNLPLPASSIDDWIKPEYQDTMEPRYEAAIVRALNTIQSSIPHRELAIQIDCHLASSAEYTTLSPPSQTSVDLQSTMRLAQCAARLAAHISPDVDLGFYITHTTASTPGGALRKIVDIALAIWSQSPRPISWFHLPLPSNAGDEVPMTSLQRLTPDILDSGAQLVLGLVLPHDEGGSRRRLNHAVECLGRRDFGIAASCSLADLPHEEFEDVVRVLRGVSGRTG